MWDPQLNGTAVQETCVEKWTEINFKITITIFFNFVYCRTGKQWVFQILLANQFFFLWLTQNSHSSWFKIILFFLCFSAVVARIAELFTASEKSVAVCFSRIAFIWVHQLLTMHAVQWAILKIEDILRKTRKKRFSPHTYKLNIFVQLIMLSRQSVLSCSAINEILMSAALPTKNIFIVFIKKTTPWSCGILQDVALLKWWWYNPEVYHFQLLYWTKTEQFINILPANICFELRTSC